MTTPHDARLPFADAFNFRELGGIPAADGRRVRRGLLYRSGDLDQLTTGADWENLTGLGLRFVLDLRSKGESIEHPDPVLPGAEQLRICAMRHGDGSEMDFSPEGLQRILEEKTRDEQRLGRTMDDYEWYTALYNRMPFGNPAYRTLFRLLEEGRTPLLFHCTAGKDRTGFAAILILLALGVDRDTALADYMLTNVYRREAIEASLRGLSHEEQDRKLSLEGVNYKMGAAMIDEIFKRYGTLEAYFESEYGLDAARLERLRGMYLE